MAAKDGSIEIALSNGAFFTNAAADDFVFRTTTNQQNILFGTTSNAAAALVITSNNQLWVGNGLGVGKSNPQYTVDIAGNINFTGNLTRNGATLFSSSFSFSSNTINTFTCLPVRKSFIVSTSNQAVFDLLGGGTYIATQDQTEVYLNGVKLSYLTSNLKDYDLDVSYPNGYSTNYRVTLTDPAEYNDVVDITVWPASAASNPLTGIFCSNVSFTSNLTTGSITVTSNLSIGGDLTVGRVIYMDELYVQYTGATSNLTILQGGSGGGGGGSIQYISPNSNGLILYTQSNIDSSQIRFVASNNGSNLVVINGLGNVGIGTSNATSPLTVIGDASITGNVTISSGASISGGATISGNTRFGGGGVLGTGFTASSVQPPTNGLVIQGNVGIGRSNPSVTLDVNGTMNIASNLSVGGTISACNITVSNITIYQVNVTQSNVVATNGLMVGSDFSNVAPPSNGAIIQASVGIGTSNPAGRLTVENGSMWIRTSNSATQIMYINPGTVSLLQGSNMISVASNWPNYGMGCSESGIVQVSGFYGLQLATGGLTQTYLTRDGLLGIGISNPAAPLDVNSNSRFRDTMMFSNDTNWAATPANGVTGGAGTRIVLWPGSATTTPYALGITGGALWYSVPTGGNHLWYHGTTAQMQLTSGELTVTGDLVAFGTISDSNLKTNVQPLLSSLDIINQLRPVTFQWKEDIFQSSKRGKQDVGFVAQEVEPVIPLAVGEFVMQDMPTRYKNLKHERILPYAIKAIQELCEEVTALRQRVEVLEGRQ